MKTNILKKYACLLLMGGLFVPAHQVKAGDDHPLLLTATAGIMLLPFFFVIIASDIKKEANKLTINEAHDIITAFFDKEKQATISLKKFIHSLVKFNLPVFFPAKSNAPKMYLKIQENLNKLPEDLQELFKAISEEEFCENMKQLKSETPAPAIKVQETKAETTEEVATEICSETVSA